MVTLRQIEAFKAVIDAGTVVGAAEALRRSQPSVSRLLSDLEASIGYRLFDRRKGKLTPRDEAREFYVEIDRCFVGLQQITDVAERIGRRRTTHLKVATLPILTLGPLAGVVERFLETHPDVFVSLESRTRRQILDGLANNQHDIGLASLPIVDPRVDSRRLASVECICIVPANHPLAVLDVITPQDLDGTTCIVGAENTPVRRKLVQTLDDAGVSPGVRIEVTTAYEGIGLVAQGIGVCLGWSIMNDMAVRQGLHAIPLRPQLWADLGLLFPVNRPPDPLTAEFADAYATAVRDWQAGAA